MNALDVTLLRNREKLRNRLGRSVTKDEAKSLMKELGGTLLDIAPYEELRHVRKVIDWRSMCKAQGRRRGSTVRGGMCGLMVETYDGLDMSEWVEYLDAYRQGLRFTMPEATRYALARLSGANHLEAGMFALLWRRPG